MENEYVLHPSKISMTMGVYQFDSKNEYTFWKKNIAKCHINKNFYENYPHKW